MSMNINPVIPLSYNLADGRKKYVLFCGAGVSKDAGIPTGWDILLKTLRLIRAQEEGTSKEWTDNEMETYYKTNYKESTYSEIIGSLFPSVEDQREFLEKIFENKAPGKAHKLIAEWVKTGLIRFIITTNFDSLIEKALDDAGMWGKYSVITNGQQVLTSKPWHLVDNCRIYKIHGTIEQGQIRNTDKDLEKLDEDIEKHFLDIIEGHGVIVLGYGGNKEDKAVMVSFNRRRFKGYTLYWAFHEKVSDNVQELVDRQDGRFIKINNASTFLEEVLSRVEIARRGVEQTSVAVTEESFKRLIATGSDVEIRQTLDAERRKLRKNFEIILEDVNEGDYKSLWDGYLKIFDTSLNFLSLVDQISKYRHEYWENVLPIFEEIHTLSEHQGRHGKDGLVNYYFYSLLEPIGGILLENKAFKLLNSLLKLKRLGYNREGIEPILAWNCYAEFIRIKNDEESKERGEKWIFPHMHYLLQSIEAKDIPFEYDLRQRIIDVDLLFFVYSVISPIDSYYPYWTPQSSQYLAHYGSDLLKMIKHNHEFGVRIATELFEVKTDQHNFLIKKLGEAKSVFKEKVIDQYHIPWMRNPFDDF